MSVSHRPMCQDTLVLGATGFLGLNLVETLVAEGLRPRCAHRKRSNTIGIRRLGVERVIADVSDADSLASAMTGVDTVFHLAGYYPRHGRDPEGAIARGTSETQAVLDACASAGVKRLVYVSSTATTAPPVEGLAASELDVYPAPPHIGTYHDVKWHMEALALAEDRFEVVVACPGACLGAWDLRVGTSALLVAVANGAPLVWPDGIVNLVDAKDVALTLVNLARMVAPPRRVLIAGHDIRLSEFLPQLAARFGAVAPPPPVSAAEAIAYADAEEARVADTPERPGLAREIADLVVHGTPLDTGLARNVLGRDWRSLDATIADFTSFARKMRFISSPS